MPPVEPSAEETPTLRTPTPSLLEPAEPRVFNFRFSADEEFKAKFERLAEVLGVENPSKHMAKIFERAVDISLDKKDPKKKHEQRVEKQRRQSAERKKSRAREILEKTEAGGGEEGNVKSRTIPSEVRERVLERAAYQCQFQAPDGTRCSARTRLEIDHGRLFAVYRSHDEGRLRVLCRRHDQYMAKRFCGTAFIHRKIFEDREVFSTEFVSSR